MLSAECNQLCTQHYLLALTQEQGLAIRPPDLGTLFVINPCDRVLNEVARKVHAELLSSAACWVCGKLALPALLGRGIQFPGPKWLLGRPLQETLRSRAYLVPRAGPSRPVLGDILSLAANVRRARPTARAGAPPLNDFGFSWPNRFSAALTRSNSYAILQW
jgi:hypothetical protein